MKTVCAKSVLRGEQAFETIGSVVVVPDDKIDCKSIEDAEMLITRSKTRIGSELLKSKNKLRFIGTATAGYDHIDTELLDDRRIAWSAAPGCNATSVAEYVVAALLEMAVHEGRELAGRSIAVIGVGEVGRRVAERARGLGMSVLLNDPPRAENEPHGNFMELEHILPQADIITIHTPLTDRGIYPTLKMADRDFMAALKHGCTFVNAARGEIVDEPALIDAIDAGIIKHSILDVWDGEPFCNPDLLARVDIATPHIAGYSFDGKLRGTGMVYRKSCELLGISPCWNESEYLPKSPLEECILSEMNGHDESLLLELVRQIYDIRNDDRNMRPRRNLSREDHALLFKRLRGDYPVRREFAGTKVHVDPENKELAAKVRSLGFETVQ